AEDGIRDRNVTGVQTCALPIFTYQYRKNHKFKRKTSVRDKITENDLLKAAELEFKKTKEYKEGYRIVKRLNANVIENGVSSRILDRKSTRLNCSKVSCSYLVFC